MPDDAQTADTGADAAASDAAAASDNAVAAFDPTVKVTGEGVPSVWKPFEGKTLADVAEQHSTLRQELSTRGEADKATKAEIAQLKADLKEAQKPTGNTVVPAEKFSEALSNYFATGTVPAEFAALVEKQGVVIPSSHLANIFEHFNARRGAFFEAAKEFTGNHEPAELEAFLRSGESGFSEAAVVGMLELQEKGDASFMRTVANQYDAFLEAGGRRAVVQGADPRMQHGDQLRGKPAQAEDKGFKSRKEYMEAIAAANVSGDRAKVKEVETKLAESNITKWPDR